MSYAALTLLSSIGILAVLLTLLVGAFLAGLAMRRGRTGVLPLLAFVIAMVGILSSGAATAFVRSESIEPGPKFLALAGGNLVHVVSLVVSYVLLFVALFGRQRDPAGPGPGEPPP